MAGSPLRVREVFLSTQTSILAAVALALAPLLVGGELPAQTAAGGDLPTVAVLDFTGLMIGEGGNSAPLGKAISAMLVTELSDRPGMRVIERAQLQDILQEQRLSLSGRVDESTAIEVGRMLGAQYVIKGQATSVASMLRMDMQAVDVETSEVREVQKLTGATDELLTLVVRIADLFTSQLELDPPSNRSDVQEIPVQATIEFSRGVDFEDRGEVDQALEHYRAALEIFPEHRDAQAAVERLTGGG